MHNMFPIPTGFARWIDQGNASRRGWGRGGRWEGGKTRRGGRRRGVGEKRRGGEKGTQERPTTHFEFALVIIKVGTVHVGDMKAGQSGNALKPPKKDPKWKRNLACGFVDVMGRRFVRRNERIIGCYLVLNERVSFVCKCAERSEENCKDGKTKKHINRQKK